ncbi:MAG: hypothetical protein ACT4QC_12285 [Planctomycetaceae bacterium]
MSGHEPLIDADLETLARRLGAVALPLSPDERNRLLYACGEAAGRASARNLGYWTTAAASFGLLVGGFLISVIGQTRSQAPLGNAPLRSSASHETGDHLIPSVERRARDAEERVDSIARRVTDRMPLPQSLDSQDEKKSLPPPGERQHLTAGTSFEDMLRLLDSRPTVIEPPDGRIAPSPPLRPYSTFIP